MRLSRIKQLALLASGFRDFVQNPVTYPQAVHELTQRLANRENHFIDFAKRLMYDIPGSPLRRLLVWAGCEFSDLQANVRSHGIEKTLEGLRDEGVYLTLEEFKSLTPICRPGLTLHTRGTDFENPFLMGRRIEGSSSGSRGKSTRAVYDWDFIAEESAHELLLYTLHGVLQAPLALWYPVLPGVAGIHNLFMNLKLGVVPEKWFSHLPTRFADVSLETRLTLEFLYWGGRACGLPVPRPEYVDLSGARRIVEWMEGARKTNGLSVVRTYGSSAVRIAQAALEKGTDLEGSVIFTGGEPLTESRRRFIESAGLKAYPRYVATETGLIGAACPHRSVVDDMHLYTDRVALIPLGQEAGTREGQVERFLFTTLSAHTARIMLNTELGDCGRLNTQRCGCLFGEIGFDVHLSNVHSYEKLTVEGMSLLTSELDSMISASLEEMGAPPDCYQFWEMQEHEGLSRVVIAVSPDVKHLDEDRLIGAILEKLRRANPRTALASRFWNQAGVFRVIRERPRLTEWQKLLPALKRREPSSIEENHVSATPAPRR
ncbi:MAG: hypothetical protein LAO21_18075 [Acidobacteriia bacterium]|nr:hypothetical protein [Terriglobia bacterium]